MSSIPEGIKIPEFVFRGAPLDKEQAGNLLRLIMASMEKGEKNLDEEDTISGMFLSQVAIKRIEAYGLPKITAPFFLASLMTFMKSPGMVMGMLWLAKCYSDKTGKKRLTVQDWCEMFPLGTPTEKECNEWWDSQKVTWKRQGMESDNMVDYPELWGFKVISEDTDVTV
jgi:hypothetical protein